MNLVAAAVPFVLVVQSLERPPTVLPVLDSTQLARSLEVADAHARQPALRTLALTAPRAREFFLSTA